MKKIVSVFFLFSVFCLSSAEFSQSILFKNSVNLISVKNIQFQYDKSFSFLKGEVDDVFSFRVGGENIIRRAEVIFFGSLTFSTFIGWLLFSAYNSIIHGDTFGTLKRYQFLSLYLGGSVLAFSVSLSDLLIRLRPFMKRVEFF